MMKSDVIIIGSGLGGLLCGAILSREGMSVCILEKHHQPGGCLQTFIRNGVEFDTGVHYIGGLDEGEVLHRYFSYFGLTGKELFRRMNPDGFDVISFNDIEYPIAMGFDNFTEQLLPFFPDQEGSLRSYTNKLQEISRSFPLYNLEIPGNHSENQYKDQSALKYYQNLNSPSLFGEGAGERGHLSSVLAGNNFLYAGERDKTPLYIAALVNHSFISGAWRPVDGSNRMATILVNQILSNGGQLLTKQEVSKIRFGNDTFTAITRDGLNFQAERLISDIHPSATISMFDGIPVRKSWSGRMINFGNTISSFSLYLVFKENSFKNLDHNFYFHTSYDVWSARSARIWPSFYMLHTPAYSGMNEYAKSAIIMTYMDFNEVRTWDKTIVGSRGRSYNEWKEKKTELLLDLVEHKFPGIRACLKSIDAASPLTWRDYTGTPEGSMYGIQKDFNHPLETIVLPRTKIPGLFFTGQNTNLHGVLGVTIGAVQTCSELIGLEYLLKKIKND